MIKKRMILSLWSILFFLFFFAFASNAIGGPAWKWPDALLIGTPQIGTGGHAQTSAWAGIMEKNTGMKVRAIPDPSLSSSTHRTILGELTMNCATLASQAMYMEGREGTEASPKGELRVFWHANDTPWGVACKSDSDLKTIYDIKKFAEAGKKVRIAVAQSFPTLILWAKDVIPAFLGISGKKEVMKNIVFVPIGTYAASVKSIVEGKADVSVISPISPVTLQVDSSPGIRWLDMPAAEKKGWTEALMMDGNMIPTRLSLGVKSAIGREGFVSTYVYTIRAQAGTEMVYQVAKWLHQNFEAYKKSHSLCERMSIEVFRDYLNYCPMPVHDGTIRYLKEIGQWAATDDTWNQEGKKLVGRYVEAWKVATDQAAKKKIKIAHDNKEWVDLWNSTVKDIPKLKVRLK